MKKQLFECEYCHGMTPIDDRGHCSACGAPHNPHIMLAEIEKYHRMEMDNILPFAMQYPIISAACSTAEYMPINKRYYGGV